MKTIICLLTLQLFIVLVTNAQNVGIGTLTPQAPLTVAPNKTVLFGGDTLNAGTKMMWLPAKGAFRVGTVDNVNWNPDSIGNWSFASGYDTRAKGSSSTAMGSRTTASGLYSTAMGIETTASGDPSTAMGFGSTASGNSSTSIGNNSVASGDNSTAMGAGTLAFGEFSTAMGVFTTASGYSSTAMGERTTASGSVSTAMGNLTTASGNSSTAMGQTTFSKAFASLSIGRFNDSINSSNKTNWISTDPLLILGNGSSNESRSNALVVYKNGTLQLQNQTSTPANISDKFYVLNNIPYYGTNKLEPSQLEKITEGGNTGWRLLGRNPADYGNIGRDAVDLSLSNTNSITTGASGNTSIAMGVNTTASGIFSTATGAGTIASGFYSTAMGTGTTASGNISTAIGWNTIASGNNSTAMGRTTVSKAYASVSIGQFNDSIASSDKEFWVATDPLLILGNGTFTVRSNALVVYKNGNTDINGFTRLGEAAEAAPKIKMKKLIVTTSATSTGQAAINHGIDVSKIISVTTLLEWTTGFFAPPEYSSDPLLRYNYFVTPTQIIIQNTAANCAYICGKQVKILITYEQ